MIMEVIFSKQVPLIFKVADREERRNVLSEWLTVCSSLFQKLMENKKVHVQVHILLQSSKHDSKKDLVVKLTDDEDLLFLYTLRLAESDFHSLKTQQGLLVDFTAFPQKFVDLLEMCIRENSKENPKFVIHFVSGAHSLLADDAPYVLNIVETNPFRHLNHLSLRLLPGSDTDVKSHLASCLKQLKETNSLIQHKYEHTYKDLSSQLHETQELLASKSGELESLKLEWSSRISEVTSKHKEEMAIEKEKAIQFQSNFQVRYERERRELEQGHSKLLKQLESRLAEYETNNKELTDRKYKSESSIRDYKSKLAILEEEYSRVKSELNSLRKENTSIDHTCQEKEKSISHLQTRVAVLEQELKDKAEVAAKSNDLFDLEKDKKKRLEADIENRSKEISRLETKVKAMGDELKKGNEIIKKLQGEVKSYHSKVKLRTQIATEQEKLLGEKDSELEKLRQELAKTKDKLRDTEDQNQRLTTNLETASQKLEESKKLLKTNENMIQWLNKQINEQRVNLNHVGNFELPSSLASQPRPAVAVHNYSASSHGSAMSQDSLRVQAMQRATSGSHLQQTEQQAGYGVISNQLLGNPRKSAIPVAQGPVNTSPTSQNTLNNSGGDKNPPLDPKFFMRKEEAVPVRGILNYNNNHLKSSAAPSLMLSSAVSSLGLQQQGSGQAPIVPPAFGHPASSAAQPHVSASRTAGGHLLENGSVRLSQQIIVSKQQPPLVSAYFPSHS